MSIADDISSREVTWPVTSCYLFLQFDNDTTDGNQTEAYYMYSVSLPSFFSLTVQPCNIICSAWVLAHKAEHMILHERSAACMK